MSVVEKKEPQAPAPKDTENKEKLGSPTKDSRGRFVKGNRCGGGYQYAKARAMLQDALMRSVSPSDIRDIMQKLISMAKKGNISAAKEVLSRCLGTYPEWSDPDDDSPEAMILITPQGTTITLTQGDPLPIQDDSTSTT